MFRLRTPGVELTESDPTSPVADAELVAEALAADPEAPVPPPDAVPLWTLTDPGTSAPLPAWYMPPPMRARVLTGWRRRLVRWNVALIIASFLAINAAGLCNTYGQLHF